MVAGIVQGEQSAIFLLRVGPFVEIEERFGLPEESIGAEIFGNLVDGKVERGEGGIAAAELIEGLGLEYFRRRGEFGLRIFFQQAR